MRSTHSHDGVHHDVENDGGERAALGDIAFGAEGATVIASGAVDKNGLVPKSVDEVGRLRSYFRILQNQEAPLSVHAAKHPTKIQKQDAIEGEFFAIKGCVRCCVL